MWEVDRWKYFGESWKFSSVVRYSFVVWLILDGLRNKNMKSLVRIGIFFKSVVLRECRGDNDGQSNCRDMMRKAVYGDQR
jgi:hypothetical protein